MTKNTQGAVLRRHIRNRLVDRRVWPAQTALRTAARAADVVAPDDVARAYVEEIVAFAADLAETLVADARPDEDAERRGRLRPRIVLERSAVARAAERLRTKESPQETGSKISGRSNNGEDRNS